MVALAHASGVSFESVVGDYRVDIGYDPDALAAGAAQVFDFALIDMATKRQVPVSEIWVRIIENEGERTLLASGLRESDFGRTTLLYVFPKEGSYSISASFRREEETVAEATFPFAVTAGEVSAFSVDALSAGLGAIGAGVLGALICWYWHRRRATP